VCQRRVSARYIEYLKSWVPTSLMSYGGKMLFDPSDSPRNAGEGFWCPASSSYGGLEGRGPDANASVETRASWQPCSSLSSTYPES
jgi:hypothetical protein